MKNMSNPPDYRPDIDGLRAIAVLGVVLCHANPRWLPGGYVGVDVFFVISGFLITSILFRQMAVGTFSLTGFYERRIRRILPVLVLVLFSVLVVGWWMMPWDYQPLGWSVKHSILSISNVYFNKATGGYFGSNAEDMPLLHTWSLGVEEQYYLIIPCFFWMATKFPKFQKWIGWCFVVAGLVSFGLAAWWIKRNASDTFYLLPFRIWEFAMGAILAWWAPSYATGCKVSVGTLLSDVRSMNAGGWKDHRLVDGLCHVAGVVGLGMILWAMFWYDKTTLFPGPAAFLPCAGTVLVIASDLRKRHAVGWFLGLRPIVFVGLISYSVYLWHWPVLVFHRYFAENAPWGSSIQVSAGVLVCGSLLLGAVSWKWIEQPFRGKKIPIRPVIIGSVLFAVLAIAFSKGMDWTRGFEGRLPAISRTILKGRDDHDPNALQLGENPPDSPILYGDRTGVPSIAIWGDSHALAIANELGEIASKHGVGAALYLRWGNPPLVDFWHSDSSLRGYNRAVMDRICKNPSIKKVVLLARWSLATRGRMPGTYGPAERGQQATPSMKHPDGTPVTDLAEADVLFADSLQVTLAQLRQAGKAVCLVYPIPETACDIPNVLATAAFYGGDPAAYRLEAKQLFYGRQAVMLSLFDSIPEDRFLVKLKPHQYLLAPDGSIRLLLEGKYPVYSDDNHLSWHGAHLLAPMLEEIFPEEGTIHPPSIFKDPRQ